MKKSPNKNPEDLLRKFFDDELSPDEEKKALHLIAEDGELRSMLKFERFLSDSLSGNEPDIQSFSVPDNFSDDVMGQIYQMEEKPVAEESESYFDLFKQMVLSWFQPRQFSPVFVYALPVVLLAGFFFLNNEPSENTPVTETTSETKFASTDESEERVWIRFVYIDEDADQLAVAGNFSDWEPIEMDSQLMDGKRVWTGLVPVERGEHHYMFVKNGEEWVTDPLADMQRDDGFGNKNAVIYL
ncbi:MAG: hypothetical protein WD381_05995 [Balneolaceae bacterium]